MILVVCGDLQVFLVQTSLSQRIIHISCTYDRCERPSTPYLHKILVDGIIIVRPSTSYLHKILVDGIIIVWLNWYMHIQWFRSHDCITWPHDCLMALDCIIHILKISLATVSSYRVFLSDCCMVWWSLVYFSDCCCSWWSEVHQEHQQSLCKYDGCFYV
jgi:hypothetical protein